MKAKMKGRKFNFHAIQQTLQKALLFSQHLKGTYKMQTMGADYFYSPQRLYSRICD